jgi:hypothetical protein
VCNDYSRGNIFFLSNTLNIDLKGKYFFVLKHSWPNDQGQTIQWRNDKGQTMQWPNDKGQAMQWRNEKKTNYL